MAKSCKGLAMELVKCLSETDCVKVGRLLPSSVPCPLVPTPAARRALLRFRLCASALRGSEFGCNPQARWLFLSVRGRGTGTDDADSLSEFSAVLEMTRAIYSLLMWFLCRCRRGRTRSAPGRRCPTSPASAPACGRPTSTARGARHVLIAVNLSLPPFF